VVNLLVNPHQAETLSLAGNETRIQLVLRNPMDTEITSPPGSYMSDLFDGPRPRVSARPAGPRAPLPSVVVLEPPRRSEVPVVAGLETVDVFNGAARTVAQFPKSGFPQ
jgi:pilus assembly protein CpaB